MWQKKGAELVVRLNIGVELALLASLLLSDSMLRTRMARYE
jgi:hypothetical protein